MTKDKELKAVFIMMQDMKARISSLENHIKSISEDKPKTSGCCEHCKDIEAIQEEVQNQVEFNANEVAKISSELDLVDKGMDRLFNRTNDLSKKLIATPAQSFSVVRQNPLQFARTSPNERSRPEQFRQPRARICYNCRWPGHIAVNCPKPNPRLLALSELRPTSKLKLSDHLKRKSAPDPETNSVEPEVSATFGTVLVPIQENGYYEPYVYPNGSSNPML